jgi:hypothetical protein
MRNQVLLALSTAVMALVLGAAPARGAEKKAAAAAPAAGAAAKTGDAAKEGEGPKVKVEKGAGGKKIYRITEEIRIEGKIQKPEAFFFYQKSAINYDWDELKNPFRQKILDSVEQAPL